LIETRQRTLEFTTGCCEKLIVFNLMRLEEQK